MGGTGKLEACQWDCQIDVCCQHATGKAHALPVPPKGTQVDQSRGAGGVPCTGGCAGWTIVECVGWGSGLPRPMADFIFATSSSGIGPLGSAGATRSLLSFRLGPS